MQAPEDQPRQYEVWIGGLHNFERQYERLLHPMTPAQTMQSHYRFLGDLDSNGNPRHEPAHVAWPFEICYVSETGGLSLRILRPTRYVIHRPGIERGDVIASIENLTVLKAGVYFAYPWGATATFRWADPTAPNGGLDDLTVMIKRPERFGADVHLHLRALLSRLREAGEEGVLYVTSV